MDPTTEAGAPPSTPPPSGARAGGTVAPGGAALRGYADAAFALLRGLETSPRGLTENAADLVLVPRRGAHTCSATLASCSTCSCSG